MYKFKSFFWVLLILFSGCKELDISTIQSFHIKGFSAKGIEADILFEIENPRILPIVIKEGEFILTIDGKELGKSTLVHEVKLKQRHKDRYYFPVSIQLSNDYSSYLSIIKIIKKSKSQILLKGWVYARSGLFQKKYDFEMELNKDQLTFL